MALATPVAAYKNREAIASRGRGACSPMFWPSMRRGMPARVVPTTLPTGGVPRAGRA